MLAGATGAATPGAACGRTVSDVSRATAAGRADATAPCAAAVPARARASAFCTTDATTCGLKGLVM